jgi:hypothetical protein
MYKKGHSWYGRDKESELYVPRNLNENFNSDNITDTGILPATHLERPDKE